MALILDGTDGITSSGGTNVLQDDAVITANIANGAVVAAKIADGAVTALKLAAGVGGKVLQVVTATNNTRFITSSTTFVGANLFSSITPTSASSKILVLVSSHINNNSTAGVQISYTLFRNGTTNLATDANATAVRFGFAIGAPNIRIEVPMSMTYLDSPNTTSSVSYRVFVRASGSANVEIPGATNQIETMTLMEIAA